MSDLPLFETDQSKQIQELQAQVERLRGFLDRLAPDDDADEVVSMCDWDRIEILKETPAQSLNEIKADAIDAMVDSEDIPWYANREMMRIDDILNYAKQLREGE